MEAHRLGLPLAVGIAVVAAGAATFALRPRSGLIEPAPVAAKAYFSPSELDRVHDYREPQRWLALGGLAIEGGTLALLALRPPRRLRRALERGRARPGRGGGGGGGGGRGRGRPPAGPGGGGGGALPPPLVVRDPAADRRRV